MKFSILSVLVTFFALTFAFSENHVVEVVKRQGDTGSGGNDSASQSESITSAEPAASSSAAQSTASSLASEVGSSAASSISASANAASSTAGAALPIASVNHQWAVAGVAALAGALAL